MSKHLHRSNIFSDAKFKETSVEGLKKTKKKPSNVKFCWGRTLKKWWQTKLQLSGQLDHVRPYYANTLKFQYQKMTHTNEYIFILIQEDNSKGIIFY